MTPSNDSPPDPSAREEGATTVPPGGAGRAWGARDLVLGVLASLVLVLVNDAYVAARVGWMHGARADGTGFSQASDHHLYVAMAQTSEAYAQDPEAHVPPFCYRVLTPWIAAQWMRLGLSADAAFYLLMHVGLVGFLTLLYLLALEWGLERRLALLGLVLAAGMQGAVRWYSLQYWMTDPLALLLLALGVRLVRQERWSLLALTSVLGMLNKDTYLIFFPYVFLAELRRAGLRAGLLRTLQVAWVPLIAAGVVRHYVVPLETKSLHDVVKPIVQWRAQFFPLHLYTATIGSLGVLLPLLLLFPQRLLRCVRERYPELALAAGYLATLLVATNTDRELAYTLPALLPLALVHLRDLLRTTGVPFAAAAAVLVGVQVWFWLRTDFTEHSIQPVRWDVVAAVGVVWLVGLGLQLGARRRGPAARW